MKAVSKRTLIALLAVMLLIISSVGATVAYFSDTDKAEGAAVLNLKGESRIDEGDKDFKEITVTNTGKPDLIVRVRLFGVDTAKMDVSVPEGWAEGSDGWYYYKNILASGQDTGSPITVKMKGSLSEKEIAELGDSFEVTVVHEATPLVYDGGTVVVPDGWTLPSGVPAQ